MWFMKSSMEFICAACASCKEYIDMTAEDAPPMMRAITITPSNVMKTMKPLTDFGGSSTDALPIMMIDTWRRRPVERGPSVKISK